MDEETRDPNLQAWFAETTEPLHDTVFTQSVMQDVDRIRRWKIARRAVLALTLALISVPAQDIGVIVAEAFVAQLVNVPNQAVAVLLAPINSVGGVLSMVLLLIRAMHRRLFT